MTSRVVLYVLLAAVLTLPTIAQVKIESIGPHVGARAPDFSGIDQFGNTQTLRSVLGPQGAMLVFFRSADW